MRVILIAAFLFCAVPTSSAQEWHGLKPLESTCEDVKRELGVSKCEYPRSRYHFENEIIHIEFVACPCPIVCYDDLPGLNLPLGTVTGIRRELSSGLPVANFNVDREGWTQLRTDFIGHVIYSNEELGLTLSAIDRRVVTITYDAPVEKYRQHRCPKCSESTSAKEAQETPALWFNSYGDMKIEEERRHLNKFATKLKQYPDSIGYIVTYRSCLSQNDETKVRAERAKEHLVNTHHVGSERIMIIDGGQRESMLIELHVRANGQPPPRTFSSSYPKVGCQNTE